MAEIGIGAAGTTAGLWAGRKVVGPVLDEIGQDLRTRYSERRSQNTERILKIAHAKLGPAADEDGSVAPRAALRIVEEGSWCDAEVMAEYFGGILAASRSRDGTDDRGATWAALVSRLSTYDVYLHYLAYDAFRRLYVGTEDLNLGDADTRNSCEVYLPAGNTLQAMGLAVTLENWLRFATPSISALLREDLLGEFHASGSADHISKTKYVDASDSGLVFVPSVPGVELFLWAHGHGVLTLNNILHPGLTFETQGDLGRVDGARIVVDMVRERGERLAQEQTPQS